MSAADTAPPTDPYRVGTGKWRVGPPEGKVAICAEISEKNDAGLAKLKCVKGLKRAEIIDFALDTVLKMNPDEIASKIRERREQQTP
jgi:hypothetical protein